ncbi:FHA domain-containing protein [Streptomyces sp. NPDC089799]|uniref:FHA domain-containing protein n=1 Tax=Streptomyces sp. NPDC089799 TaxID=3155066 RepID=UPI00341675B5
MQIRLTVIGPRSGHQSAPAPASCDVLVTAPVGTPLSAVASGLAGAVGGPDTGGTVVLYAGADRLDPQRAVLGEPPLVDGAVLAVHGPVPDRPGGPAQLALLARSERPALLEVVAGPDAGGVHLLHPGEVRIGRSGDADVPLDDPDVSRQHCAVLVGEDGRVAVTDLNSTNGTTVDGTAVGPAPVALPPGALLRVGESTLRLSPAGTPVPLPLTPDLEGHLTLPPPPARYDARPAATPPTGYGAQESPSAGADPSGRPAHGAAPGHGPSPSGGARPGPGGHSPGSHTGQGTPGPSSGHGPAGTAARAAGHDQDPYGAPGSPAHGTAARAAGHDPGPHAAPGTAAPAGHGRPPAPDQGHAPATAHPILPAMPSQARPAGPADPTAGHAPAPYGTPGTPAAARPGTATRPPAHDPGPHAAPGTATAPAGHGHRPAGAGDRGAGAPGGPGRAPLAAEPHAGTAGQARPAQPAGGGRAPAPQQGAAAAPAAVGYAPFGHRPQGGGPAGTGAPGTGGSPGAGTGAGSRLRAWARRWVGREAAAADEDVAETPAGLLPDEGNPATLLLAALAPSAELWAGAAPTVSAHPGRPTDRPAAPLTVALGAGSRVTLTGPGAGALGLAGPRARLTGLTRSVLAQLAARHGPGELEIVLLANDRTRPAEQRVQDWGWLGWLPHTRPAHGQDCRLLLAYDRDQAAARAAELSRRLDDGPLGSGWSAAEPDAVRQAAEAYRGPYTVVLVDGDPGPGPLRDLTRRLASHGPAAGIHLLCVAEAPAASPASPVTETFEAACAAAPAFRDCGTVALLSGDVATAVRVFPVSGGRLGADSGTATADGVSAAWAERFARALAPLRTGSAVPAAARPAAALPQTARLLDELGLARATPASLMARWAEATDQGQSVGGHAQIVLGSGRGGPVGLELVSEGPHLVIEGPPGSGRTELLRSVAASLASAARPDRLGLLLLDGAGGKRGEGLAPCTDLPHVSAHLVASDPLRMREFAQALGAELKRRDELLAGVPFTEWHEQREVSDRMVAPRRPAPGELRGEGRGDLDSPRTGTLRLRAQAGDRSRAEAGPAPLPRLVVLVDDFDALTSPALGSTGRPAAGSVVRALEAVAREGARLGVHLVTAGARPERTADTEPARQSRLRVELDAPDRPGPGRGVLHHPEGRMTPFQAGRVTGRIPRTATQRPTVVPLEWERMGDPPARRPVRELGNGPTDLALLASALDRASHLVSAIPVAFPPAP